MSQQLFCNESFLRGVCKVAVLFALKRNRKWQWKRGLARFCLKWKDPNFQKSDGKCPKMSLKVCTSHSCCLCTLWPVKPVCCVTSATRCSDSCCHIFLGELITVLPLLLFRNVFFLLYLNFTVTAAQELHLDTGWFQLCCVWGKSRSEPGRKRLIITGASWKRRGFTQKRYDWKWFF